MSFTRDLLVGLAQMLDDHGAGTWRPTGAYQPGDLTPIVYGSVPASPDRVITLRAYDVDHDPTLSDSVQGLQVRTRSPRADPLAMDDDADAVFDVLHGLDHVELSTGVLIVLGERRSSTPMGRDKNEREERSDNYYLTVHRPGPNRL